MQACMFHRPLLRGDVAGKGEGTTAAIKRFVGVENVQKYFLKTLC